MAVPKTFDPLFARYGEEIPVRYLRALAWHESRMKPQTQTGSHRGLLQVSNAVREEFNKTFRSNYTKDQLFEPRVGINIGAWQLGRIIRAYKRTGIRNLQVDWDNPEFVRLLTAGYNAAWSKAAGVPRVALYLKSKGKPVTHANVYGYAKRAGGSRHLQNTAKRLWQEKVYQTYRGEPRATVKSKAKPTTATGGAGWLILLAAWMLLSDK